MQIKKKDVGVLLKGTINFTQYGIVKSTEFKRKKFILTFWLNLLYGNLVGPLGIAIALLDIMQGISKLVRKFKVEEVEVRCYVGEDLHIVSTKCSVLDDIWDAARGKRDLLTSGILNSWIESSKYQIQKKGGSDEARVRNEV